MEEKENSPPPPPTTVRRNPYRRARNTPFVPSSLSKFNAEAVATTLAPFSLDEAPEPLPPLPSPSPSPSPAKPSDTSTSSNLRVFLRIRPVDIKPQPRPHPGAKNAKPRARTKGASPQKATKKKKPEVCLAVNSSESVTLTIPKSKLVDSKRGNKSEVYDGFSFVFPSESLQTDVYDKVMHPLVKDFMGGKSALLVAMGPTGSGKTHTMFGSNREPGLVPLALKKIFSCGEKSSSRHRSFYLAMLEIYSVSGKGEKMIDLLSDGADLTLVQSSIKGLEEVPVSDLEGAERLVARGMLKRSTAATDANSQSSRSQCIITIRRAKDVFCTGNDMPFGNGILVIADLAGAERERKTGNLGSRLGESHFINNTSMVFGLCLRSLLEHQKNPKRPLEMHYKNSLLTRYLKEYLEGKKRMTLILTVKPGEDDYADTSYVLRQAAPYMKIKYTNIEEAPPVQKRNNIAPTQHGNKKRRKVDSTDSSSVGGEAYVDSTEAVKISQKVNSEKPEVVQPIEDSAIAKTGATVDMCDVNGGLKTELQKAKRNEVIMTQFAKTFWKTLKLYKDKLLKSENEVNSMSGIIVEKNNRITELERELAKLKSFKKRSEQTISSLDENELSAKTDDSKHFKCSDYQNSSAGSVERGAPSNSSNSTAFSSVHPLKFSLLSDCEQVTVPSIMEDNEVKQSQNHINEVKEKCNIQFDSTKPEIFLDGNTSEKHFVEGDPLEMVCLDSDTDEGQMPSTENVMQSSVQFIKVATPKDGSPKGSSAEGSDGKLILRFEGSTAISPRGCVASASTASGKIDLLSDFEQATVLLDHEKAGKRSEDLLEEEKEDASCDNITENNCDPHFAEGDPLQMVCPDSDTEDVKVLSTVFEIQCSPQLHKAKASEDEVTRTSLLNEARRQSIEFTSEDSCLSGDVFSEVSGVKKTSSFEGSGGGFSEVSGVKQASSFEGSTEKHFDGLDPLQMVCSHSDVDEGQMLDAESQTMHCTNIEISASEFPDNSSSLVIEACRESVEFKLACYFGGHFAKECCEERDLDSKVLADELKNDTLDQAISESADKHNNISSNLCQTIREPEIGALNNYEINDLESVTVIEKEEENSSCTVDLEHHEFLPDHILKEEHLSKDDLLQMVCPDSDTDEGEMLSTEKKIQFYAQHNEAKASNNANSSPLITEAKRHSSERARQRNSSLGAYFGSGSEARKVLSYEDSTDEASDNTLKHVGSEEDATNSTASFSSHETFHDCQQDNTCSSEELELELENEKGANSEELREKTTHSLGGEKSYLPVDIEPKTTESSSDPEKLPLTSLDYEGKSSIERRKENQPIKSLIEVIGKENRASLSKPCIARKPKRRLRPASSMLLKEFTSPDIDPDIPKEGRGKTSAEEMARSEGSMSLIQLLTRPIREKNI